MRLTDVGRPPLQGLWHPAPGAGEAPVPVQVLLLLHRHLLHRGLRRRHPPDLALAAAGGLPHLCGAGGAASAGRDPGRVRHSREMEGAW